MAQSTQNADSHTQWTPIYHFFTSPLAIIFLIWSAKRLVANPGLDTAYFMVGALAIFGLVAVARLSPLRVQDRLIRPQSEYTGPKGLKLDR